MTDRFYATVIGVVIGMGFLSFLYVFTQSSDVDTQNLDGNATFEVVDKYKECDIVRYTQHNFAEYKYFLYCEKNK